MSRDRAMRELYGPLVDVVEGLISAAAEAIELFDEDDLERFAAAQKCARERARKEVDDAAQPTPER